MREKVIELDRGHFGCTVGRYEFRMHKRMYSMSTTPACLARIMHRKVERIEKDLGDLIFDGWILLDHAGLYLLKHQPKRGPHEFAALFGFGDIARMTIIEHILVKIDEAMAARLRPQLESLQSMVKVVVENNEDLKKFIAEHAELVESHDNVVGIVRCFAGALHAIAEKVHGEHPIAGQLAAMAGVLGEQFGMEKMGGAAPN